MPTIQKNHFDVVVLGAGAAGLLCAATAARRGRKVLVIEKANKVGKKILMSGGGRCNFSNYFVEPEHFISNNPHFCKSALKRFTQWDFIAMVERHGIPYEERKHSQLFCLRSASDILNMLLDECETAGVTIQHRATASKIEPVHDGATKVRYTLTISNAKKSSPEFASVVCESLVVATGALSIPSLGGSGAGYDIATQFKLPLVSRRAGLVPFTFSDRLKPLCERLSGLACEVEVSCNGTIFRENMLFTHRGMSGPAILQISNYWRDGDELSVNLLPDINVHEWLLGIKQHQGSLLLRSVLTKHLSKSLVRELQAIAWPDHHHKAIAEYSDAALAEIASFLNDWRVRPSGTEGYRTAEVTLGGVDTNGVNSKNMEAKSQPGLYFIGEVLDVTGHLGGFNFQWAWSSGYTAGVFA